MFFSVYSWHVPTPAPFEPADEVNRAKPATHDPRGTVQEGQSEPAATGGGLGRCQLVRTSRRHQTISVTEVHWFYTLAAFRLISISWFCCLVE